MSALRYAVLGLLLERPSHPYELARIFVDRVGPAWELSHGSVSQMMSRLTDEGLVERLKRRSEIKGGVESWVYGITERGEAVFYEWLDGEEDKPWPVRDELFVKVALCKTKDIPQVIEAIERRERLYEDRLRRYRKRDLKLTSGNSSNRLEQLTSRRLLAVTIEQLESDVARLGRIRDDLEGFLETPPSDTKGG